jgi:hypothetical protein
MIPAPFLLYLGRTADPLGIKTSRGVAPSGARIASASSGTTIAR